MFQQIGRQWEADMLDVLIQGGSVVSPHSTELCDVGIANGRIVVLAAPQSLDIAAARVIDASGKLVVPGGIDAHVHFNIALTPAMRAQSAKYGGRAAAFGGTTTFIDFALQAGADSLTAAIEAKQAEINNDRPDVDYALHAMITGATTFEVLEEIPEAISGGVSSFKMFTTFSGGSASGGLFMDDGRIWGVMQQLAKHNGIAMVHCEDDCIIDFCVRKLYRHGHQHAAHVHEARPSICEEASIMRMLLLSRRTGSPLYIVHVSSIEGVEAIADARGKRQPVYGESLHNYLAFSNEDYAKPDGMIYHNYPALKSPRDRAALWEALKSGVLDVTSSDDFTIPLAQKLAGKEVDNVSGGHNGIETRMAYLFSEGVKAGKLSINRFVEVSSTAVAKLFGLYPRKGIIAVGSDADVVIIDPNLKRRLTLADLHSNCDYSLWDGWEFNGFPILTMVRGQVLVENGKWTGPEGIGQFIPARSPSEP
jgi:dihydropyrimidinase